MPQVPRFRYFALATILATSAVYASGLIGDAERGRQLFVANSCPACHGVTEGATTMVGPSLYGIVGRKAGTTPSLLGASENLKAYGVIWTAETLNEFLSDPNAKVPNTPMTGKIVDPQQRVDVIAYLSTLTD